MIFANAKRVFGIGSPLSSMKLLVGIGTSSRPAYRSFLLTLLRPFIRDGEISIRYRCYDRYYRTLLRMGDLNADCLSTRELCSFDIYHLDRGFDPDLVVDGGGNIGLFTLRAAASSPPNRTSAVKLVVCEPLPRNIKQIRKHLDLNGLEAEIMPICLGGTRRSIPFYCRGANESSFDSHAPYDSVLDIPVVLLQDAVGDHPAERILIKLDIEGMEVETLETFLPQEQRPVYIVGELHDFPKNAPLMEDLFNRHGWTHELFDIDTETSSFRACSPAAVPLVGWAAAKSGNQVVSDR
jgi:FkbM family methyltransferase